MTPDSAETPDIRYGRLLESAHISGYSFERLCDELLWLLDGDRWQKVGPGYVDVNAFLRTIDLSPFNLGENRPRLHKRIKELQPKASTRAIGQMTGTPHTTVQDHVRNRTDQGSGTINEQGKQESDVRSRTPDPVSQSGREAAQAAKKVAAAKQKQVEKEERKEQQQTERAEATAKVAERMAAGVTPDEPGVVASPWWQLGDHLLYCGDSTDEEFIARAKGAAFAFADPPYNTGKAEWDNEFEWRHDYLVEVAEVAAVTPGISAVADFFRVTDMPYRWSISAWITNGMTRGALGFGNWIYVALFSGAGSLHRNAQDHMRITVDATTTEDTAHESRKPARLLVDLLQLFTSEGDTVVDPFLGSGTTLFAAEQTGRRCIAAEINPKFYREVIARYGPKARPL